MKTAAAKRRSVWVLTAAGIACDFTSGANLNVCQDSIPAPCGAIAHCVMGESDFVQGSFPGSQTLIVRTSVPKIITFQFVFTNREAAGTSLTLTSTEPDCSEQFSYTSQGDLFELAGPDGVLSFPIQMTTAGDHLVQFQSDAYCNYEMRYE